jgi:hypothetical protein
MPWQEHRLLSGFLPFKCGETSVEDGEHAGIPPLIAQAMTWIKLTQFTILEITGRWNMAVNSKTGLEDWIDLCKACASVTHR